MFELYSFKISCQYLDTFLKYLFIITSFALYLVDGGGCDKLPGGVVETGGGGKTKDLWVISSSTIAFGFEYFNFDIFLIASTISGLPFGVISVFILKGVDVLLSISIFIIKSWLSKFTKSNLEKPGSNQAA